MKISFATTCMGRLHHLMQTLPQNIRDNPSSLVLNIEFVLLNYSSRDGMDEWVKSDPFIRSQIENGTVSYAHYRNADFFHHAHAKNIAHRLATGDFICNLDADNFTGPGFASFLSDVFRKNKDAIVNPCNHALRNLRLRGALGAFGRIALGRENFYKIGGYDETVKGWGYEDSDLKHRAKGLGLRHAHFDNEEFMRVIAHGEELCVANTPNENGFDKEIEKISIIREGKRNIASKLAYVFDAVTRPVQVNKGKYFGQGTVYMDLDEKVDILGAVAIEKLPSWRVSTLGAIEMIKGRIHPRILHHSYHQLNYTD